MKMSKEKRNQLVLVFLVTGIALGGLWFGLISFQKESLVRIAEKKATADQKLKQVKASIASADSIEEQLKSASAQLKRSGLAGGALSAALAGAAHRDSASSPIRASARRPIVLACTHQLWSFKRGKKERNRSAESKWRGR